MSFSLAALPHLVPSGLLALRAVVRFGLLPFPTGLAVILFLSQLVFTLVAAGTIDYPHLALFGRGGTRLHFERTLLVYDAAALFTFFACHGAGAAPVVPAERAPQPLPLLLRLGAGVALLLAGLTVWSIDRHHAIAHAGYLNVAFDQGFVHRFGAPLAATLHRLCPFLAALLAALLVAFLVLRQRALALLFGLLSACSYLYLLSINTRTAAFGPAILALGALGLRPRGAMAIAFSSGLLVVYALLNALLGREAPAEGLAMLPDTFAAVWSPAGAAAALHLLPNLCEGIFVVAEGFGLEARFGAAYTWLSLSPLPSLADGFVDVLPQQVRLHAYVPMAAVTELWRFGLLPAALVLLLVYGLVRAHFTLRRASPVAFLAVNFLLFATLFVGFAYPVRSALKFLWLGYAIVVLTRCTDMSTRRSAAPDIASSPARGLP
ncbi:hypothetical protein [Prosthecomicrobium pneumaticum]|uniref:Uncharacterized protein n=1 Tax=Prosthecomicrobium pneumaticum TaxID=81895 RepID=A0A7W9FL85_9HYPH|nr:hypothetical protein [Prosthecomicrobium pneumaticum]MBB5752653.1 hypothetical protein [Prosthecomicrobium pneumaticum]